MSELPFELTRDALRAQSAALRAVARALLRHEHDAEDAAQDAWVAALRHPPQRAEGRAAWLTRVARNFARRIRRDARLRRRHEGAAARPVCLPSVQEAVERVALQQQIVEAVLALEEPYRATVVLRYFEGRPPREVARAMGVPVATVRTRLHRALAMLRARLDRTFGSRAAWTGLLACGSVAVPSAVSAVGVLGIGVGFMMKKLILAAGVLAAVALVWVSIEWPAGSIESTRQAAAPATVAEGQAIEPRAPQHEPDATQREEARRTPAKETNQAGWSPGVLRVLVVDGASGRPEPQAEVLYTAPEAVAALSDRDYESYQRYQLDPLGLRQSDVEACARRFGTIVRTADDGTVKVPRPRLSSTMTLAARAGARYGEARNDQYSDEVRIELRADRTLRVRTAGADGTAVPRVKLGLEVQWPDSGAPELHTLGTSDASGILVFPHFQEILAAWQVRHPAPPRSIAVVATMPGIRTARVSLDAKAIPTDPVLLSLPATGRVAVEIRRGGSLFPVVTSVHLREVATDPEPPAPPRSSAAKGSRFVSGAGHIDAGLVGLGATFHLQCMSLPLPAQEGPGPTEPGQEVVFRFELPEAQPFVRARVRDGSGAAATGRRVRWWMQWDGGRREGTQATDAEGLLCFPLDAGLVGRTVQILELEELRRDGRSTGRMARALPGPVPAGDLDLGELVLREGPQIAAGTITYADGSPCHIVLEIRPAAAAGERRAPPLFASAVVERGRFTIRGFVEEDDLALVCRVSWPTDPILFRRGATDLRVVLRRPLHPLAIVVRHDLRYEQLMALRPLAIEEQSGARADWGGFSPLAADRVRLRVDDMVAGRYTVQVLLPGDPVPLASIGGVEIGPSVPPDPRLREIDIRGKLHVAALTLVDPVGQPAGARGWLMLGDEARIEVEDGVLRVPIGSQPATGTLRVPGFRDVVLRGIDGDRIVQLEYPVQARVRVQPAPVLPPDVTLQAFARRKDAKENPLAAMFGHPIAGSGIAGTPGPQPGCFTIHLPTAGEHVFFVVLARGSKSVALAVTPQAATVDGSDRELVFTTTEDDVRRALAELPR